MVGLTGEVAGGEPDLVGVPPLPPRWITGGARVSVCAGSDLPLDRLFWAVVGQVGLLGRPELKIS
jgi:hypothetical protein